MIPWFLVPASKRKNGAVKCQRDVIKQTSPDLDSSGQALSTWRRTRERGQNEAASQRLNSEPNDEVSDTTGDDSSNTAGSPKNHLKQLF
jgi:hypothetical protein